MQSPSSALPVNQIAPVTAGFQAISRLSSGILGEMNEDGGQPYVTTRRGESGIVLFGPYDERPAGRYRVRFRLGLADAVAPLGDAVCAKIEVTTDQGHVSFGERFVRFAELSDTLATFEIDCRLIEPRTLEYRIHSTGQVMLRSGLDVGVESLDAADTAVAPRGSQERAWANESELLDGYLRNISGLIHIGANLGQERRYYWLIGVDVLWVEPIREVYEKMVDNIAPYSRQRAINALVGARDGEEVTFGIASNNGASSSMLPLKDHAVLFPDVEYSEQRPLTTVTLGTLIQEHGIRLDDYQALTLDTEGAELMILQGAGELLKHFRYIKCEVADFPARTGTPTTEDLDKLLSGLGFTQLSRRSFGMGPNDVGSFWDVVWKREEAGQPLHRPDVSLPMIMNPWEVHDLEKCE